MQQTHFTKNKYHNKKKAKLTFKFYSDYKTTKVISKYALKIKKKTKKKFVNISPHSHI